MPPPTKRTRRPLSGLIISSDPPSETLKAKAERLGATYTPQLTDTTTHFLTETAGSKSHRKAQTQRTLILRTKWLHECHNASLLVPTKTHFLPPLSELTICCSGLDAQDKAAMEALCRDTGANYSRTLGKHCTHLLCDTPTGRKYDFAKSCAGILVVRSRWLQECARGNVLLDEAPFFLPVTPCNTVTGTATVSGTEVAPSGVPGTQPSQPSQRVSKQTSSSLLDGAVLYFPPSTVSDRIKHAPLHAKALRLAAMIGATVSSTLSPLVTHVIILRCPVTATVQRSLKGCSAVVTTLTWLEDVMKMGRIVETYEYKDVVREKQKERPKQESNTFLGVRACLGPLALRDATAASAVENVLLSGRGKVLSHDSCGNATYGVATHIVFAADMQEGDGEVLRRARVENECVVAVTPFWVEMSHSAEKLIPAKECILFRPVGYGVPVEGMTGLGITISGFQKGGCWDFRREILRRLAILVGCRYSDRMRRTGTRVVVAEQEGSDKVRKAREWGIDVVRAEWLHECVRVGSFVDVAKWRLGTEGTVVDNGDGADVVDDAAIQVFEKFKDGIEASGGIVEERRRIRSRSVSRDEWSMDASQSQLILHRDLTPPVSPSS